MRLPLTLAPREDSSTGTAAPMAMPSVMGKATENVIVPVMASACRMPTAADALCRMQVNTVPTSTPSSGLEKRVSSWMNAALSLSGATAPLMEDMPYMSTAKPSRMSPMWCRVRSLQNIRSTMPATATMPVSVAVLSSDTQPEPLMSDRQRIQPVMLVPRMEPSTMPMAWRTCIMPELTKPTTMTDVAEDDWITAVTPVPSRTPLSGVLVSL